MSESPHPRIEVTIAAPVDAVWHALRDPGELRHWFGWEYAGIEDEIRLIFVEDVVEHAGRSLTLNGGDRFDLEARGDRTVVRVTRAAAADQDDWDGIYDEIDEGWLTFVQQLRFYLERHQGQGRRTLMFTGLRPGSDTPSPAVLLGLTRTDEGERVEVRTPSGDTLAGRVWFRSRHQVGVTVDTFGDGLLVLMDAPSSHRPPHGGAGALLTTYGLDDRGFDEVRRHWNDWWSGTYRDTEVSEAS